MTFEEDISPLLQACALNNDVTKHTDGSWQGDSTEVALMELAGNSRINPVEWPRVAGIGIWFRAKNDDHFPQAGRQDHVYHKGAPDMLLQRCSGIEPLQLHHAVDRLAPRKDNALLVSPTGFGTACQNNLIQKFMNKASHSSGLLAW